MRFLRVGRQRNADECTLHSVYIISTCARRLGFPFSSSSFFFTLRRAGGKPARILLARARAEKSPVRDIRALLRKRKFTKLALVYQVYMYYVYVYYAHCETLRKFSIASTSVAAVGAFQPRNSASHRSLLLSSIITYPVFYPRMRASARVIAFLFQGCTIH